MNNCFFTQITLIEFLHDKKVKNTTNRFLWQNSNSISSCNGAVIFICVERVGGGGNISMSGGSSVGRCGRRGFYIKVKVIPQQAEVAQGVPGSLRLRIFLTFDTTRVVGRQP